MTEKKKEKEKCVCHTPWSLKAISFHSDVKGRLITLSDGGRRVTRDVSSFCHGLTFSGRPVEREKVRLRVERSDGGWHGALRLGFAHVSPEQTPLPPLAIPDLTNSPLYAAVLVPEHICRAGSEVQFWLKKNGSLRIRSSDGRTHTEPTTLNPEWPVWAMIDVYGQTTAVTMLGSKKKRWLFTSWSCPAHTHNKHTEDKETQGRKKLVSMLEQRNLRNHHPDNTDHEAPDCEECVVCYSNVANCRLSCGHKCVCTPCAMRVHMIFGTCPLCRLPLGSFHPYDHKPPS
ncbi:E3 ubiquitin-protein ligase NEURL3-like [Sinocyclocheilus rhinocerous]|uniref:E3 ubiquitin-protein ligase NEURL3-like n=1 Tax=Sinocyclocheilus rhinocerous TaxID=307959 RepID=A0A673LWX9_9TELE|nr:PREDICTED: E3 ubiquitin-protein ligase NEURL3-like [Sinocyclocheilus rhinocerous]